MPEAKFCSSCGSALMPGVTSGLCARCLLKRGMETPTIGFEQTGAVPPAGRWEPPTPAELAGQFANMEVLELLGRGGMGAVYKAHQTQLDRVVALKVLPPGIAGDADFAGRFSREAKALARLNHPNIVTLYEFGQTTSGLYYFLMEYVDGTNLRQLMDRMRIAPREALAIVPQVCDALQFAHDKGIVHRDIKPENILLDRRGHVKVADFGLAKLAGYDDTPAGDAPASTDVTLTTAGKVVGTPQYMAPEQETGFGSVDHRADIYALGVVFYQMLTGELPGRPAEAVSRKFHLDVRLDEVVLRALEREPSLRYAQASAMKSQLETIAAPAAVTAGANDVGGADVAPSRFSRKAIVGAVWAPLLFLVLLLYMGVRVESRPGGEAVPMGPTPWQILLQIVVMTLGGTAPFGTTILGWIAVADIRRSAGRIYGLGLAIFDGLLFPLLALDIFFCALIVKLGYIIVEFYANPGLATGAGVHPVFITRLANLLASNSEILPLCAVAIAIVMDVLIIRWVWRAVTRPSDVRQRGPVAPSPHRRVSAGGILLVAGFIVIGLLVVIMLFRYLVQPVTSGPMPVSPAVSTSTDSSVQITSSRQSEHRDTESKKGDITDNK